MPTPRSQAASPGSQDKNNMTVPKTASLLKKSVVCVEPTATVAKAAQLMKKANIGSVFVGTAEKPLGIFTERDIARRVVAEGVDPGKTAVSEVMTKKLVTVDSHEPLEKIFECLAQGQFRHVPITEGGKVVGIVSLSDLAKILKELYQDDQFLKSFCDTLEPPKH